MILSIKSTIELSDSADEWNLGQPKVGVNSKSYWDSVYSKEIESGKSRIETGRFILINSILGTMKQTHEPTKLIDIGCGTGELTDFLKKHNPTWEIWGADISHVALDKARSNNRTVMYSNHPLVTEEFGKEYYDYVLSSHTLEHIEKPEFMLQQIVRILKPSGKAIIVLPLEDEPYNEHFHMFTKNSAISLIEDNHLEVISIEVRKRGKFYQSGREIEEIILVAVKK